MWILLISKRTIERGGSGNLFLSPLTIRGQLNGALASGDWRRVSLLRRLFRLLLRLHVNQLLELVDVIVHHDVGCADLIREYVIRLFVSQHFLLQQLAESRCD